MSRQAGFTLMEVLVVVVLIGIILSFATLSIGNGAQASLRQEAERLAALLRLAAEESVWARRETGVRFEADGYAFFRLAQGRWQAWAGEGVFRARRLPEGMALEFSQPAGPLPALSNSPADSAPQVVLFSSGESTPFTGVLRLNGQVYQVEGDAIGGFAARP